GRTKAYGDDAAAIWIPTNEAKALTESTRAANGAFRNSSRLTKRARAVARRNRPSPIGMSAGRLRLGRQALAKLCASRPIVSPLEYLRHLLASPADKPARALHLRPLASLLRRLRSR